jgi:hypothetical protein
MKQACDGERKVLDEQIRRHEIDVVAWAYSDDPWAPMQDWDLMLADPHDGEFLLRLASDPLCPKRDFFLHCLYILVGDYVRVLCAGVRTPVALDGLLKVAEANENLTIGTWLHRSRNLIAHPETFDYDFWCNGGFART